MQCGHWPSGLGTPWREAIFREALSWKNHWRGGQKKSVRKLTENWGSRPKHGSHMSKIRIQRRWNEKVVREQRLSNTYSAIPTGSLCIGLLLFSSIISLSYLFKPLCPSPPFQFIMEISGILERVVQWIPCNHHLVLTITFCFIWPPTFQGRWLMKFKANPRCHILWTINTSHTSLTDKVKKKKRTKLGVPRWFSR